MYPLSWTSAGKIDVYKRQEEPAQVQSKEEPKADLKSEPQEPELKDLIRQMLVDMQRS